MVIAWAANIFRLFFEYLSGRVGESARKHFFHYLLTILWSRTKNFFQYFLTILWSRPENIFFNFFCAVAALGHTPSIRLLGVAKFKKSNFQLPKGPCGKHLEHKGEPKVFKLPVGKDRVIQIASPNDNSTTALSKV